MTFNDSLVIKDGDVNIKGVGFLALNKKNISNDNSIIITSNNFKTFNKIDFPFPIIKSKLVKDDIYILSSDWKTNLNNVFFIVNQKGRIKCTQLNYNCFDFCMRNDEILFIGEKDDENHLFTLDKEKNAKVLFKFNNKVSPQKIYAYNEFISILFQKLKTTGINYFLMNSFDNGKSFNEEVLPIDNYVTPIEFYKDDLMIYYAGAGRICKGYINKALVLENN